MRCDNCGRETLTDFKFCPSCGSSASESNRTRVIPDSNYNPNPPRQNQNHDNIIRPSGLKRPIAVVLISIYAIIKGVATIVIMGSVYWAILTNPLNINFFTQQFMRSYSSSPAELIIMQALVASFVTIIMIIMALLLIIGVLYIVSGYSMLKGLKFSWYTMLSLTILEMITSISIFIILFTALNSIYKTIPDFTVFITIIIYLVINIMVLYYLQDSKVKAYLKK